MDNRTMGKTKSVIFENMDCCLICGSPSTQIHHIFFGTANRKISDQYGYVVELCQEHHTGNHGVHFNKELDNNLKKIAQEHFEANYGTREDFIKVFGRSFIF